MTNKYVREMSFFAAGGKTSLPLRRMSAGNLKQSLSCQEFKILNYNYLYYLDFHKSEYSKIMTVLVGCATSSQKWA